MFGLRRHRLPFGSCSADCKRGRRKGKKKRRRRRDEEEEEGENEEEVEEEEEEVEEVEEVEEIVVHWMSEERLSGWLVMLYRKADGGPADATASHVTCSAVRLTGASPLCGIKDQFGREGGSSTSAGRC